MRAWRGERPHVSRAWQNGPSRVPSLGDAGFVWRGQWPFEEHPERAGQVSGRSLVEGLQGALNRQGIETGNTWGLRQRADREGLAWYVTSPWRDLSFRLFETAADAERRAP